MRLLRAGGRAALVGITLSAAAISFAGFVASTNPSKPNAALVGNAIDPFKNPFANQRVVSPEALATHLGTDDQALGRYMMHFAETREQVVDRVRTLRLSRLDRDGVFTVYTANRQEIKSGQLRLKKGTAVFVDDSGQPMLLAFCGNPISEGSALVLTESGPERALGLADSVGRLFGALGSAAVLSTVATGEGVLEQQPVPEPATLFAFGLGAAGLAIRRRKLRR